jgi:formylglycine-generating enzyme required for sulfatase activity
VIHAGGISVRHAVARALATLNRSPSDATWRLLSARATVDARGRVVRAEVTLRGEEPGSEPAGGLVNPDGEHPMMATLPGTSGVLMDIMPVTWDRWCRAMGGSPPTGVDPWVPRTGVEHGQAVAYARAVGKRLPTPEEFRAAWGTRQLPWGDAPDPERGLVTPPRWGEIPESALFPPHRGFFDLGAWLWQWCADGTLLGGAPGLVPGTPGSEPIGFRCVS